ncbi:hypothetical protein JG559_12265 [Enterococcus faecalis]|uniref:Uncharacterized protein n=1 Tax=Enterococcus faecalis TaxID=1351 RepID=A0A974NZL6_ENTFL|nr:hypothetical protein JG559_12265 [Enterococcus faecalis]
MKKIGRSIPDYFEKNMVKRLFREQETQLLKELSKKIQPSFQLGAGLLSDQKNRSLLKIFSASDLFTCDTRRAVKKNRRRY